MVNDGCCGHGIFNKYNMIPVCEGLSQRYDYGCHHFRLQRKET